MPYIEFQHINKYFGENHVLRDINLGIEKGSFVTLLGPSGCGKSTLLRCLSGLESIDEGRIILDGSDITGTEPRARSIGMVFQQYSLFPNMTVSENIAFGLRLKKLPEETIRKKIRDAVEMVELCGKEDAYPSALSGGQQQRVALARSIALEPKVLLLDEPFSAIDAKLRKSLQKSIRQIHKELGLTSVFVTHDQDEAMVMSDVIHLFHGGKIEQSGDPVSIYTRPASEFAAGFIGSYNLISEEAFARLTGDAQAGKNGTVAVRPETIEISDTEDAEEDMYSFTGVILDNTPRGNVLRYRVGVEGVYLNVDVLFRSRVLFSSGDAVHLRVAKHNCIHFAA